MSLSLWWSRVIRPSRIEFLDPAMVAVGAGGSRAEGWEEHNDRSPWQFFACHHHVLGQTYLKGGHRAWAFNRHSHALHSQGLKIPPQGKSGWTNGSWCLRFNTGQRKVLEFRNHGISCASLMLWFCGLTHILHP